MGTPIVLPAQSDYQYINAGIGWYPWELTATLAPTSRAHQRVNCSRVADHDLIRTFSV